MGFSVSASTAIILVGLFLAFGILYPAMSNGYEQVYDAESDHEDTQRELRNTNINITEISGSTINVTNEGSVSLDAAAIDVVVDGEYRTRDSYNPDVEGDGTTELWLPGETLEITPSDISAGSGDQVRIVTDNGISVTGEVP